MNQKIGLWKTERERWIIVFNLNGINFRNSFRNFSHALLWERLIYIALTHILYQPLNVSVLVVIRMRFSLYLKAYTCRQEFWEFKGCILCQCHNLIHSRKFAKPFTKLRCNQLKGISFYFCSMPTEVPKNIWYELEFISSREDTRYRWVCSENRKKVATATFEQTERKKIGNENCIRSWCAMCIAYLHLLWNMLFGVVLFFPSPVCLLFHRINSSPLYAPNM